MAKRRKRQRDAEPRTAVQPASSKTEQKRNLNVPTFFRLKLVNAQAREAFRELHSMLLMELWPRDREQVRRIEQARTATELLDLATSVTGLAVQAWEDRIHRFGSEILPLIQQRLEAAKDIQDEKGQELTIERLIAELRWRGLDGAFILMDCFDKLNNYGKSLASVILGLLGLRAAADLIWSFYQSVVDDADDTYLVGALWGLIDLKDERVSAALADLLNQGRTFSELMPFVAMAGDERAVVPLAFRLLEAPKDESSDVSMALLGVAHRIGREAFTAELRKLFTPGQGEKVAALVDRWMALPASAVEEYFDIFYRGLTPEDVRHVIEGYGSPED